MPGTTTSFAIVDRKRRLLAFGAMAPKGGDWEEVMKSLDKMMVEGRGRMKLTKMKTHRRGKYITSPFGISFGGGQMVSYYHRISCKPSLFIEARPPEASEG